MKIVLMRLCLAAVLALPLGAHALMNETEAQAAVVTMLEQGRSASDVIAALQADGRDLIDATIFALVVGGEENRVAFARAGVASARSVSEAQSVANALYAAAGMTGPVAATVTDALAEYKKLMDPPPTYRGSGVAVGSRGSVSPSD